MDVDWHILFFNAFPKSDSSPSVKSVGQTSPACVADASLFDTTLRHRHAAKRAFDAIGAPRALSGARVHVSNHHAEPDAAAAEPTRASAPFDDEPGGYGYFVFLDDEAPSGRGPKPAVEVQKPVARSPSQPVDRSPLVARSPPAARAVRSPSAAMSPPAAPIFSSAPASFRGGATRALPLTEHARRRRLLGPKNADQPQSKKRQKTPTPAVGLPSLRPIG